MVTSTAAPPPTATPPIEPRAESASRVSLLLGVPGAVIPRLRSYAATTPGRLTASMIGLILLSVLTGVIGLVTLTDRANTVSDLVANREPVDAAAEQIYRSLSDADGTASSAFLAGAMEPASFRTRYQDDIAQAGAALAVAAQDSGGVTQASKPLVELATNLPVYTGLVERATTNNEQGYPIGAAFLSEADSLMRNTLLPNAQQLYSIDSNRLATEQDDASNIPWLPAILVIGLAVALVFTQRYVSRRTNRTFNVGLVAASIAVLVVLLWGGIATTMESVFVSNGRSEGSDQVAVLDQARTDALQARTDEVLTLVGRGSVDYTSQFSTLMTNLIGTDGNGGLLGQVLANSSSPSMGFQVNTAVTAAKIWQSLDTVIKSANNGGDYQTAVQIALGQDQTRNESAAFYAVDAALANAVTAGRSTFLQETDTASDWLIALPIGVLVLSLVSAFGATFGVWQRLKEYR